MKLYLMRHGLAAPVGGAIATDEARPLTEEGKKIVARVTRGLARADVAFDHVFSSPLTRARETAGIMMDLAQSGRKLQITDTLVSGCPLDGFLALLEKNKIGAGASVLAVGHMPSVGDWLGELITRTDAYEIPFDTASIACVRLVPGSLPGMLEWFAPPGLLARLDSTTP